MIHPSCGRTYQKALNYSLSEMKNISSKLFLLTLRMNITGESKPKSAKDSILAFSSKDVSSFAGRSSRQRGRVGKWFLKNASRPRVSRGVKDISIVLENE